MSSRVDPDPLPPLWANTVHSGFAVNTVGCCYSLEASCQDISNEYSQCMFSKRKKQSKYLGPVVQSVVSLMTSLRVISLTVLADPIHNILIFFAEKM